MSKSKLLFVNESLELAGGEKSLIALLNNIDKSRYDVDLQLFAYNGKLMEFLPEYVNVLPPLSYTRFVNAPIKHQLCDVIKFKNVNFFISKLKYSYKLRQKNLNHPEKAQLYWECVSKNIEESHKEYDVAIAYAQGVPTFYVIDKVKARKKIAWVNVNIKMTSTNKLFQQEYYKKYDTIVAVSENTQQYISRLFPELDNKIVTIRDIIDYEFISTMALKQHVEFDKSTYNILTVARLNKLQKGYDISLEALKILVNKGYKVHWNAIGEGPFKEEMQNYLNENRLTDFFTFLGTTTNPYPYFLAANLYVQTSRHEGFGLSIAEARLLNIPVVTTNFDTVFMQMVDGKNGLVTEMNGEAVANAIEKMIIDTTLYRNIVEYLKSETKQDLTSVNKFYKIIE
jgi:glycosyltransferase involved in cell wall biosynthesis